MRFIAISAALLTVALTVPSAFAQDVTAANVENVVAERIVNVGKAKIMIDESNATINDAEVGNSDDGLIAVAYTDAATLFILVEPIFSGDDDSGTTSAFMILPPGDNGQTFEGELGFERDTDAGSFVANGTVTSENGETHVVSVALNQDVFQAGNTMIEVRDDRMVLSGTLGFASYDIVKQAITDHPDIKMLEITDAPGSVDDEINMLTARLVRNAGLTTFVANGSQIASGAVDLFSAGVERLVEPGAKLGVHSWCCAEDGTPAADLPADDPAHAAQLAYFTEMLGPEQGPAFYFFTLNAAPAEDIMNMSIAQMQEYGLITGTR